MHMSAEEAEEREELLAEVMDPTYLMGRDADAEGEAETQGGDMSVDFGLGVLSGGSGSVKEEVAVDAMEG
jgi:hypothetical protein